MYVTKGDEERKEKKDLTPFLALGNSNRKAAMKYSSLDTHSIDKRNSIRKLCRKGIE